MKKTIAILCIISTLISCTKDIKLNNKNQEQKDVVNCILSADSTMELVLYKSNLPLSSSSKFSLIKDAQVEILESNNTETLVFSGGDYIENGIVQGSYTSSKLVEDKKTYKLSVTGNNNKDLSAEIYIPQSPNILAPEIVFTTEETELYFTIDDPINEKNYYSIELFYTFTSYESDGVDTIYYESFQENAYLFSKKNNDDFLSFDDDLSGQKVLFSDELFTKGNTKVKLFMYEGAVYEDEYNGFYYGNLITDAYISVSSMNKSLYQYEQSIQAQLYSEGDPFSESVQIQSNIKNGIGIFGSRNTKIFEIEL